MGIGGYQLLIAIASIVVLGLPIVQVIHWLIDKTVEPLPGLAALGALFGMMGLAIWAPHPAVAPVVFLVVVLMVVFFPFASEQIMAMENRLVNVERLEKAHATLHERPDNVTAAFAIAECLHWHGYPGHAVRIVENTLNLLPNELDPFQNRSVRDIFANEARRAKEWRRRITDPHAYDPIRCPACGQMNEAGTLACARCQRPYLLEVIRGLDNRSRFYGKLLLGWALVGVCIIVGALALLVVPGGLGTVGLVAALAGIGWILHRLFWDRRGLDELHASW